MNLLRDRIIQTFIYLHIMNNRKREGRYERIYKQIKELLKKDADITANMATMAAVLHHKFEYYFWTGFYRLINGELIVGPYQGQVACIHLKKDTGVCWAAVNQNKTIVVQDVHKFPDHIACDSRSNSEIVVPVRNKGNNIVGVLDIDSSGFSAFNETDAQWLEKIVELLKDFGIE